MSDNTTQKRKRGGAHKGNNGMKGKPSNNKGKTRKAKVPRRSTLDVSIQANKALSKEEEEQDSDVEENLDHIPITAHMYRSAFVKAWCSKLLTTVVSEDSVIQTMLGHDPTENTACIVNTSESPTCHTVDHWRKNVKVKGKAYVVPEVARPTDRTVRDYHFWMYNSGNFTRAELATMVSPKNDKADKGDSAGGSHTCGGTCLNHARPEANKVNQERKAHHKKLREALEKGDIGKYKAIRTESCNHNPKCFINPGRIGGLVDSLKASNAALYQDALFKAS